MHRPVAFLTGGAAGIGLATAREFLQQGVNVAIVDFNGPALESAVAELRSIGPEILPIQTDLSETKRLGEIFQSAVKHFGQVDFLVSCAALLAASNDLLTVTEDEWDRLMHMNLKVPMLLVQSFAKHAISRGGGGRIVIVSSSSAFRAQGNRPAYGCSKSGLTALVRIAAAQLGSHDINVNAVAPGVTNTPGNTTRRNVDITFLENLVSEGPFANFFKRVSEPADIASTIAFLCAPGSRQITGQTIHVSAGLITP